MAEIQLTFPDGAQKTFEQATSLLDVAKSISTSLAKKAIAGKFNGEVVDLQQPLLEDGAIEIITKDDQAVNLTATWHTAAFVLAATLSQHYPEMQFGEVTATEDGFYYDTDNEAAKLL